MVLAPQELRDRIKELEAQVAEMNKSIDALNQELREARGQVQGGVDRTRTSGVKRVALPRIPTAHSITEDSDGSAGSSVEPVSSPAPAPPKKPRAAKGKKK